MMDDSSGCHQAFKRRKRLSGGDVYEAPALAHGQTEFPVFASASLGSFGTTQAKSPGPSMKRCRIDAPEGSNWNQSQAHQKIVSDLQRLVEHQATEIERLKSEKATVETAFAGLKAVHEKASNENKILKRAVTIQQERQNQAVSELEAARRFKSEAEDRIKKLEQMNLTLQYHLQAQAQPTPAVNDFMGFGPCPPDVY